MAGYTSRAAEALAAFLSTKDRSEATQILNDRAQVESILNSLGFTSGDLTAQDWAELRSNFG